MCDNIARDLKCKRLLRRHRRRLMLPIWPFVMPYSPYSGRCISSDMIELVAGKPFFGKHQALKRSKAYKSVGKQGHGRDNIDNKEAGRCATPAKHVASQSNPPPARPLAHPPPNMPAASQPASRPPTQTVGQHTNQPARNLPAKQPASQQTAWRADGRQARRQASRHASRRMGTQQVGMQASRQPADHLAGPPVT